MSIVDVNFTTGVGDFAVTVSFTANAGITALFGPSGSGKSVTLATIAGLLRPNAGSITLSGQIVADAARNSHVRTQDRRIGMVFQNASLLPHRTPLDNVALAVRDASSRAMRRDLARHWLERVHAAHLADAPTNTLSGGEQQRIALARALAGQPSVLLLDEPFSSLDQPTRVALRQLIRDLLVEHRIAALIVTHDVVDITNFASQVVLFEPGRTIGTHDLRSADTVQLSQLLGIT